MRHAIQGARPGETVHVGGRFVATHPVDGGARFSKAQLEELGKRGYKVRRVDDQPPGDPDPAKDQEALDRIAALREAADDAADKAGKVTKA